MKGFTRGMAGVGRTKVVSLEPRISWTRALSRQATRVVARTKKLAGGMKGKNNGKKSRDIKLDGG